MEHRYGRHGPNAWRRWRERRYGRRALSIAQEPRVAVIHLHLSLTNVERIIIVMEYDDDQGQEEEQKKLPPITIEGSLSNNSTNLLAQGEDDPFYHTRWHAIEDAKEQAEEDIEAVDIKFGSDLEKVAKTFWRKNTNRYNPAIIEEGKRTREQDEVSAVYCTTFVQTYNSEIEASRISSDEPSSKLRKKARTDYADDISHGKSLSPLHIQYQAVIRIYEQLKLDTRAASGYLENLEKYVPIYEEAYIQYRDQKEKEVDQPSGLGRFR